MIKLAAARMPRVQVWVSEPKISPTRGCQSASSPARPNPRASTSSRRMETVRFHSPKAIEADSASGTFLNPWTIPPRCSALTVSTVSPWVAMSFKKVCDEDEH
jgi:hypothetical protein